MCVTETISTRLCTNQMALKWFWGHNSVPAVFLCFVLPRALANWHILPCPQGGAVILKLEEGGAGTRKGRS